MNSSLSLALNVSMEIAFSSALFLLLECIGVPRGHTSFINRVRGPYGKLWTEFFPRALRAWGMKTRKEKARIHNLPYEPRKRG